MQPRQHSSAADAAHLRSRSRNGVQLVVKASGGALPHAAAVPWRSVLGPESRLPNVYWGALSTGSLRRLSTFTALPPPEQVLLEGEPTYRYVRQESTLWSALHAGRLTTSRLKDALGLRDRTAARIVGGPQSAEPGVTKAYMHLQQQPYVPPMSSTIGAGGESVAKLNEAARMEYNELLSREQCGPGRGGAGDDGLSEADRRRISELAALAVGAAGATRMRLLWGILQEAAAVATLTALFPTSQIEEVGLLCLSDSRPWGVELGELPQLGASPDALITHHVPITDEDIKTARAGLEGVADSSTGASTRRHEAARSSARAVLRAALARHTQQAGEALGATGGTYGSQAATSPVPPHDGLTASYYRSRSRPLYSNGSEEAVEWLAQQLLAATPGVQTSRLAGQESLTVPGPGGVWETPSASGSSDVATVVQLREVVEVKNHCPFVYKGQRKARKRGIVINYAVSDRGPVASVWPLWVPQMQAHMACSGADSALLLSRSPSRGVRLFRMFRDDAYLTSALELVRELQCSHVARNEPPGADPWVGRPGYGEFVMRTVAIARSSETVITTRSTPQVPGTDSSGFWSSR